MTERPVPTTEEGFGRVGGDPDSYRCYGMRALEREVPRAPGRGHSPADRTLTPSEDMPMSGRQEIHFFNSDFGVVISDLGLTRDFDYEFVHEDVRFYQFRLEGNSVERVSERHDPVLVQRPGFKFGAAPAGHREQSRVMTASRWRTVTPFVGDATAAQLFGEGWGLTEANELFRHWQQANGTPVLGLSGEMRAVVDAMLGCHFIGPVRRTYLEAKTIELICLAVDRLREGAQESWLTPRVSARDQARLETAREFLDTRFEDPPTLAEIGRMVGLNRRKLALGFRAQFGTSVLQYCLSHRMRLAREMLERGDPIALVAHRTGYADQASFSRAFRRHHGDTPGHFSHN